MKEMAELPKIMNKAFVAELLGVSERQVQKYISEKKLAASRPSHKVLLIYREDLQRFMQRSRI